MRPGFAGRKAGSRNLSSEIFSLPSGFVRHWAPHWDTQGASEVLGSRLAECSSGLRWNSWQGIASGLRWRARLERVPGAARLTLQVSENPIDMKLTLWVMIELKVSESTLRVCKEIIGTLWRER